MDDKVRICFDKEYKVRVLDPNKFSLAEELEKEGATFVEKIFTFREKITGLVEILESHAKRIDEKKLRAIGLRMAVGNETEKRARQQKALQALINEKRAEHDRLNLQLQSLERIESEQMAQLDRLSSAKA
mmetsp:Transcript_315/g.287  ORF Transcript_315/g.287 Transcript_315/m.287 type:complete len:130 (-) Transcript_315:63-452(-)|eukprot:CAMPEP_0182419378 /NCGR_PEP_ID=MMETSP1167-20130531/3846_1 /TAXON_ID=2988 /ORGANISM="Mallomonas Sp, Strain CCMP3275" /LENGTH=129 /DNA_ID=CAMNT_0024594273 /DNA_START=94 /DNA_END=483 /DNA_ORIENTATION=+